MREVSVNCIYMEPIGFQSKASVVCSVTAAIFIDFCLILPEETKCVFPTCWSKTNEYLNSAEQIPKN